MNKMSKKEKCNFYIRRAVISHSVWQYKEELKEKNPERIDCKMPFEIQAYFQRRGSKDRCVCVCRERQTHE